MKRLLTIGLLLSLLFQGKAQDIHFSQFTASPLSLNPAMTGLFNGDYRFGINYRDQWGSVTVPYQTMSASADFSLLKGHLGNDALGIGAYMVTDKAGDSELSTTQYHFSTAYRKTLSKQHALSGGLQMGYVQRSVNYNNLRFGNQFNGVQYDPNLSSREGMVLEQLRYVDVTAGLIYMYSIPGGDNVYAGVAIPHLIKPKQSFLNHEDLLYTRFVFHAGGNYKLSHTLSLQPSGFVYTQGPDLQMNLGSYLRWLLSDPSADSPTAFAIGGWGRFAKNWPSGILTDAIIIASKFEFQQFNLGLSYDVNVSPLFKASNYKGGPEISLQYTGPVAHKIKHKGNMVCPRF